MSYKKENIPYKINRHVKPTKETRSEQMIAEINEQSQKCPRRISSQYKRKLRKPHPCNRDILADFYDVSTDYILGRTNIKRRLK
jgi:hypothetical protein